MSIIEALNKLILDNGGDPPETGSITQSIVCLSELLKTKLPSDSEEDTDDIYNELVELIGTKLTIPSGIAADKFLRTDSNGDPEWGDAVSQTDITDAVSAWLTEHISGGAVVDSSLSTQGAAADAKATGDAVSDLKSAINELPTDKLIKLISNEDTEAYHTGSLSNAYTTSTFSGFETSWEITKNLFVNRIQLTITPRITNNITKIRLRVARKRINDPDFTKSVVYDETKDVTIYAGGSRTTVDFYPSKLVQTVVGETIYLYAQADAPCDWGFDNTNISPNPQYYYWTSGSLADGYSSAGSMNRLFVFAFGYAISEVADDLIDTNNLKDKAVSIRKTDFIETEYSANLFDPQMMATDEAWAYTGSPTTGGTVNIIANQYTNTYTAIKIPLHENTSNVSIIRYSGTGGSIYSYYFTNADSSCISYEYGVAYGLTSGKTLAVPSGAVYLYITLKNAHDFATAMLMVSATAEPVAYEEYAIYLTIPGLKVESGGGTGEWEHNATISLPDKYELVVGDTFELFYQGIVKAAHWEVFDVEVTCAKGNAFERKFVYTPVAADVGTINCVITLYDPYHKQMDSKTIQLVVKAKASSPVSEKVVLYVGDSLTNGGHAPGEFKRRLVASDGTPTGDSLSNIKFIGTCDNGYVNYEGYGGWTWNSYNTANSTNAFMWITVSSHDKTEAQDQHSIYKASNDTEWKLETIENGRIKIIRTTGSSALPSTGTLVWVSGGTNHSDIVYTASAQAAGNPFWDETEEKVDFGKYALTQNVSQIDYIYVLLGWNGGGTSEENTKTYVKTFIDNVLDSFPNCEITLLGLQAPARNGLATNYGASGLANYYFALSHMCNLNEWYADVASEYENVSFVNIAGQFDTKYNMPTTSVDVNIRNSSKVSIQSNGVHPLTAGYYQIADACYRDFVHKLQE